MFTALLEKVATTLDRAGIPYMVIGGQAVLRHGEARLTKDIDLTLGVDVDRLADVPRDLEDVRGILLKNPDARHAQIETVLLEFSCAVDKPFVERFQEILKATRP